MNTNTTETVYEVFGVALGALIVLLCAFFVQPFFIWMGLKFAILSPLGTLIPATVPMLTYTEVFWIWHGFKVIWSTLLPFGKGATIKTDSKKD